LLRLDDSLDSVTAAAAPRSGSAGPRNGSRRTGSGADDVTNDAIVNGVAVTDDHLRVAFTAKSSQLKVTFNIEFNG
jgi:hypothetical protein